MLQLQQLIIYDKIKLVIDMNELFESIDEASKNRLLQIMEAYNRKYDKNSIILSSVKNDDIICILLSGHVQIIKNDISGDVTIIEDIKDNGIFGAISANISSPDYEIITKEESNIIIIELDNIIKDCDNQIFLKNLLAIFYKKIKEFNNRIEILTNKTIRDKLLAYFNIMAKNNNRIIYLPFSYSELADYLSINRSAMTREIKLLKDENLIETKGRKIKLLYYI